MFTVHLHLLDDAIKLIPTLRIDIDGLIGLKGLLVNTSIDLTESELNLNGIGKGGVDVKYFD